MTNLHFKIPAFGLLLCILFSLIQPIAFGQIGLDHESMSYDELMTAIMDHPVAMKSWAEKRLMIHDGQPTSRIHALLAFVIARSELGEVEGLELYESQLRSAAEQARSLGLGAEHNKLLLLSLTVRLEKDEAYLKQKMDETMAAIGIWKRPRYMAEFFIDFAILFRAFDNKAMVHDLLKKAQSAIMSDTYPDDTIQYLVKNFVGLVLAESGDLQRSKDLYYEIAAFCRRKPLRYLGGVMTYNIGNMLERSGRKEELAEALAHYQEAATLGQSTDNTRLVGFSKMGQAKIKMMNGDLDAAHKILDQSIGIFEKFDQGYHLGDAYKIKAKIFQKQGKWASVMDYAKRADALYGADWDADHLEMKNMIHPALAHQHRFEEAYQHLLQAFQLQEKLFSRQNQEQMEKLKLELGVQVMEQKALLLEKENEEQAQSIAQARLMLLVMAAAFAGSIIMALLVYLAIKRSKQLKESRRRQRQIIESIDDTVIVIGSESKILGQPPPGLRPLFLIHDEEPPIDSLKDLLANRTNLSGDDVQIIVESLQACLGECQLSWELNEEHLPKEITVGDGQRFLELDWQPVQGSDQRIQEFILVIKDRTKEKELERNMGAVKDQADRQMALIAELARGNCRLIAGYIERLRQINAPQLSTPDEAEQCSWLRFLHTSKGTARSLGMKHLSSVLHEMEDKLLEKSAGPTDFQRLQAAVEDYQRILTDVFRIHATEGSEPEPGLVRIVGESFPDIKQRFKQQSIAVAGLDILDHYGHWNRDLAKIVADILVHGLSNSADHGFILPLQRGEKIHAPHFQISAEDHDEGLLLTVKDNGRGLDLAKIQQIAAEKGFVPEQGRPLTDVLFLDGISTAETTSTTSGRGVGLSAIQEICQRQQGRASLLPNPDGQGTMLQILIPNPSMSPLPQSA